ncbi:hypothetical protein LSH36_1491g00070 [Paralvinella palmiformis]|uniref:Peptidoglycan recognition protein family domain-containing protein n=1 Tax=Paralvinella palmiformis TaxID=53620 RepID=A0AAD9MR81_9ANNE|nr:hypothetical protein LSH36_1491g00070 [Paralvinella palmiformis]
MVPCFSTRKTDPHCEGVQKATISRTEWGAAKARQEQAMNGIADQVIVYHTGPDTCHVIGLSGYNCRLCLLDESCVKQIISAIQHQGLDNIRYNFMIDQNGIIYEGRGWGIVGQHTNGQNDKSIGVAIIGDFTKSGPSEALQTAMSDLVQCGEAGGTLAQDSNLVTSPSMSGKAFHDAVQRL